MSKEGLHSNLDFRSLIELKPPILMPHGNVGTPTKYFLEQVLKVVHMKSIVVIQLSVAVMVCFK